MSDLPFAQLTEPTKYVSPDPPAKPFDAEIAYVLGQCCNLTYQQYADYPAALPASGSLETGYTYEMIGTPLMTSEPIGTSTVTGQSGYYRAAPAGFGMKCSKGSTAFNVIAIRGTRSYSEWLEDLEAIPTPFRLGDNGGAGYPETLGQVKDLYGYVHGGFFRYYTQGTNGTQPTPSTGPQKHTYQYSPRSGSIASGVQSLAKELDSSLPLYVTGHSLGAGAAVLCAMDVGVNFAGAAPAGSLILCSLAGPLVAAGIKVSILDVPTTKFTDSFKTKVSSSYRIVNAADIVPISPPASLTLGPVTVSFAHIEGTVVEFCVQTASIGGNHSCADTYVHYLEQLAGGFGQP